MNELQTFIESIASEFDVELSLQNADDNLLQVIVVDVVDRDFRAVVAGPGNVAAIYAGLRGWAAKRRTSLKATPGE